MTPPPALQVRLLGAFEVRHGAAAVEVSGAKARTLLAMLLLAQRAGRRVRADALAEPLWGNDLPADARGSLQALVSRLRRTLEPTGVAIGYADDGYALAGPEPEIDLDTVERLADQARAAAAASRHAEAAAHCRTALGCWHGESLAEFAHHDFARTDATRFDDLRLALTETLAESLLGADEPGEALRVLEPHVAAHPLREHASAHLVVALHRCGRRADALAAYRAARERLVEELGLDPGPELRRAEALVLAATSEEVGGVAPPCWDGGARAGGAARRNAGPGGRPSAATGRGRGGRGAPPPA
ncbi:MAG: AfsR/SARP family transcriptional regulator, partial [Sporichthyaceae bacterium]